MRKLFLETFLPETEKYITISKVSRWGCFSTQVRVKKNQVCGEEVGNSQQV